MNKYKLSIIIPIYNVEKYLPKCLDSVYSQITEQCQVILVDDCSPDSCGIICDEYKEKHPYNTIVIHQENMGLGGARNSGINASEGEYLFFLDSDDYLPENAIGTLFTAMERYSADIISFPLSTVNESGDFLELYKDTMPADKVLSPKSEKQILTGYPNACNKVTRASLYKDNNILFPSHVWYEDIRTVIKMLTKADSIVYLESSLYNYLQREGSIMNNSKVDRNVEIIYAFEDIIQWFTNEGIYDDYRQEIDFLLLDHVFVSTSVRVIRSGGISHPLLRKIREFTLSSCLPDAMKNNSYTASMPKNRRLIMSLLKSKLYFLVWLIFKIKS